MRKRFGKISFCDQAQSRQHAFEPFLTLDGQMLGPVHGLGLYLAGSDQMRCKRALRNEPSVADARRFCGRNHRHWLFSVSKNSVSLPVRHRGAPLANSAEGGAARRVETPPQGDTVPAVRRHETL